MICPKCRASWSPTALRVEHRSGCRRAGEDKPRPRTSPARALLATLAGLPAAAAPARLIVLVTGGREYAGPELAAALDVLGSQIAYLVCGDARGADTIAFDWATEARARSGAGLPMRHRHEAYWRRLGRGAGHERNGRMVADALELRGRTGLPIVVLAAPGGIGTADCVRQARAAGLEVRELGTSERAALSEVG